MLDSCKSACGAQSRVKLVKIRVNYVLLWCMYEVCTEIKNGAKGEKKHNNQQPRNSTIPNTATSPSQDALSMMYHRANRSLTTLHYDKCIL